MRARPAGPASWPCSNSISSVVRRSDRCRRRVGHLRETTTRVIYWRPLFANLVAPGGQLQLPIISHTDRESNLPPLIERISEKLALANLTRRPVRTGIHFGDDDT